MNSASLRNTNNQQLSGYEESSPMNRRPILCCIRRSQRLSSAKLSRTATHSLLIVILAVSALFAQNATPANSSRKNDEMTTQLSGRVVSSAGVAVAGAIVGVENLETHKRVQVATTSDGA